MAWADGLRDLGHTVVVATTDHHFDAPPLHPDDVLLRSSWRSRRGLAELVEARRYIARFSPDIVVSEVTRDPRFLSLAPVRTPVVVTTHDARPHDAANATPVMRRVAAAVLERRASAEVCFSEHVRTELGTRKHPVHVLPLTSEMRESATPQPVPAEGRRDFLVVGRLSTYKNLPIILEAYRRHQRSDAYRGDRLVVIGGGDPGCAVPDDVEWVRGRFRFADVAPRLAAAKASICLYSAGSQSGVQVLGAQCGVRTLVSQVGGLAEYLAPGETALPFDDPSPLAVALDHLADPARAAEDGMRHRHLYEARFSTQVTAAQWVTVLDSVRRRGS